MKNMRIRFTLWLASIVILMQIGMEVITAYLKQKAEGRHMSLKAAPGFGAVGVVIGIVITGVISYIGYIIVGNFFAPAEAVNVSIQANTATDAGTVTSKTMFGLGLWVIPVGFILALLIALLVGAWKAGKVGKA